MGLNTKNEGENELPDAQEAHSVGSTAENLMRNAAFETLAIRPELVPQKPARLDPAKVQAWLDDSPDAETRSLKEKILAKMQHVSFAEYVHQLHKVTEEFNEQLKEREQEYAVLWDYKPHASRRWTYEMAQPFLRKQPAATTYFQGVTEKKTQALTRLVEKGITHFVIFDDATYSGSQVQKTIAQVKKFFVEKNLLAPSFTVVIPFTTKKARELLQEKNVTVLTAQDMPYMSDLLSLEEIKAIREKHFMDSTTMATTEGWEFDAEVTETSFDHRVADQYSFAERLAPLMTEYTKPYGDNAGSSYAEREKAEFQAYFQPKM